MPWAPSVFANDITRREPSTPQPTWLRPLFACLRLLTMPFFASLIPWVSSARLMIAHRRFRRAHPAADRFSLGGYVVQPFDVIRAQTLRRQLNRVAGVAPRFRPEGHERVLLLHKIVHEIEVGLLQEAWQLSMWSYSA